MVISLPVKRSPGVDISMKYLRKLTAEKISSLMIFSAWLWGMFYIWLILMHNVEEKVGATLLSSPFIYAALSVSLLLFLIQEKAGVLKELAIVTFFLVIIFLHLILIFNLLLLRLPDIYDFSFYYECFLIIFLGVTPMYLLLRIL
ncbi:transporter [Kosakonia pseudosacchari]|uniref:colistin resistant protein CrrC n=1 Tax=Kosakonia pseudosacchari TaxID=1646340 RepID=UPI0022F005CC|nr:transporter [Kosakonia pseudosacchari]WBU51339.1 transporter [Kosakonia pseudosacchari]